MKSQWSNFKNGRYDGDGKWHECQELGSPTTSDGIVVVIAMNGTKHARWGCTDCHQNSPVDIKHKKLIGNIDEYPVVRDRRKEYCRRCGDIEAEYHHWAPSYKFTDSANWPGSYLCRSCHRAWHLTMDPNVFKNAK